MELVRTITDTLALVQCELVDKVELGGGLEGYHIFKVLEEGDGGWKGRELAIFDEHFYTNTEFLRVGFKVKGALYHLGGFTGERAEEQERVFEQRQMDRAWEGFVLQGPIIRESHLGHVIDVGIPVHCHFTFSSNQELITRWKEGAEEPDLDRLDRQKVGDWVRVIGGLYIFMLKELKLLCASCGKRQRFLTTSLPTMDELTGMRSVCRRCKHEQVSNAFPDICDNCKKKMWQWKGNDVEFPLECECGKNRYDFYYDHRPMFVD